ncbi:GNAT family N-acetyltransferase [Microlunatus parietis]|uniref:Mycothiol synthase n=1 Tax=Microlunatus parietis TaxID=682979 RepID=A0A7Y9IAP5_9ACTN|nr:GNAT family N-acetyltransferase [Microlunatus parietis]NYE73428.1 mycothiol synthase [Microlunatus parietis]
MTSLLMRRPDLAALPAAPNGTEVAGPADGDGLARLLTACFDEPWDIERVHRDLLDDPTVTRTFVLREGDRIIATASARTLPDRYPGAGYLHWVATDPADRGRGIGFAVVVAVLHRFAAESLGASVLETDDHRLAAIKLYLRLGYVPQYPEPDHEGRWSAIFPRLLGGAA